MTVYAILSTIFVYTRVKSRTRATMNKYNVMTDLQVLAVVGYKAPMSDIRLKKRSDIPSLAGITVDAEKVKPSVFLLFGTREGI